MRIIFMGSDELACAALERLLGRQQDQVVAVITQPDRPKGRRLKVFACPAKDFAERSGVPVISPEKLGAKDAVESLAALEPDLVVVAAYGQYITPAILQLPPHGLINIHPSLLPKYRGATPIQWVLANGESETGVTILYVSEKMDAGDIICQQTASIDPADTAATLKERLSRIGADLLISALDRIRKGEVERLPQDEASATYVGKLKKEDGRIDWTLTAEEIRNRIRGFNPWPGCFCEAPEGSGKGLKIWAARVEEEQGAPGEILHAKGEGPLVATGRDSLRLLEVQPPGKPVMTGAAYLCGHPLKPGDRLG